MTSALRFAVTGAAGFLVDATILTLLLATGTLGPAVARFGSFACALVATWALNRSWSFRNRPRPRVGPEFGGYVIVQLVGFLINYVVFLSLASGFFGLTPAPIPALAVGSISSAVVTYTLLNWRLYRSSRAEPKIGSSAQAC